MADAVQVTERELETLCKMLGMLGAATVGERAAAALKVDDWVKSRGLSWRDMIIPPETSAVTVSVGGVDDTTAQMMAQAVRAAQAQAHAAMNAQAAYNAAQQAQSPYANVYGQGLGQGLGQQAYQPQQQAYQQGPAVPPWHDVLMRFIRDHRNLLRGSKELDFVNTQLQRVKLYGASTRLSVAQETWLRDILGRGGLTW